MATGADVSSRLHRGHRSLRSGRTVGAGLRRSCSVPLRVGIPNKRRLPIRPTMQSLLPEIPSIYPLKTFLVPCGSIELASLWLEGVRGGSSEQCDVFCCFNIVLLLQLWQMLSELLSLYCLFFVVYPTPRIVFQAHLSYVSTAPTCPVNF